MGHDEIRKRNSRQQSEKIHKKNITLKIDLWPFCSLFIYGYWWLVQIFNPASVLAVFTRKYSRIASNIKKTLFSLFMCASHVNISFCLFWLWLCLCLHFFRSPWNSFSYNWNQLSIDHQLFIIYLNLNIILTTIFFKLKFDTIFMGLNQIRFLSRPSNEYIWNIFQLEDCITTFFHLFLF